MNKGKFIVLEGLEGAGKSTAHQFVMDFLKQQGFSVIATREPGGTPLAEKLRQLIKEEQSEKVTDKAELLMLYAARVQLVENVIKPALEQGIWVVGDRHDWSSQAYQGGGRGIDRQLMNQLKQCVLGDFTPDFTLYLDIDPEQGLQRAKGRGELDRIEKQALPFFQRTRERYQQLAQQTPNSATIQAGESLDKVLWQIEQELTIFLTSKAN